MPFIRSDTQTASIEPLRNLRRLSALALLVVVASFTFLDYWSYSSTFHAHPGLVEALVAGHGFAPQQYRVGVLISAHELVVLSHNHLGYRHIFALFDFVFALAAGFLARAVLFRSAAFAAAGAAWQGVQVVGLVGLLAFYLNWSLWYQRPETMACALFTTASLYVLCTVRSGAVTAISLLVLAALQAFIRSDVAILFHFALFVYVLVGGPRGFLTGRRTLLGTSLVCGLLSTGVLWLLMHKIFPQATYGGTPVFQLLRNLSPVQWIPCLLFVAPALLTFAAARRASSAWQGPAQMLLLGSLLYLASWAVVGRLEEVRIFAPFAIALLPFTANAVAMRLGAP